MINIYTESGIKGPKKRDGYSIYILMATVKVKQMEKAGDGGRMIEKNDTLSLTKGLKLLNASENQAQLITLLDAMKRIKKPGELTIYVTSDWIHAGITEWIPKWKQTGWLTAKGEEVQYSDKWKDLSLLLEKNRVKVEVAQEHSYKEWMLREIENREKEKRYVREIWRNEFIY